MDEPESYLLPVADDASLENWLEHLRRLGFEISQKTRPRGWADWMAIKDGVESVVARAHSTEDGDTSYYVVVRAP